MRLFLVKQAAIHYLNFFINFEKGTTTSLESENGVEADEDQKMDENDDANEEVEVNEGIEDGNSNSTTTKPST